MDGCVRQWNNSPGIHAMDIDLVVRRCVRRSIDRRWLVAARRANILHHRCIVAPIAAGIVTTATTIAPIRNSVTIVGPRRSLIIRAVDISTISTRRMGHHIAIDTTPIATTVNASRGTMRHITRRTIAIVMRRTSHEAIITISTGHDTITHHTNIAITIVTATITMIGTTIATCEHGGNHKTVVITSLKKPPSMGDGA